MDVAVLALVGLVEFLCRFIVVLIIVCSFFGMIFLIDEDNGISGALMGILRPNSWQLIEKKYQLQGRRDS